MRQFLSSARKRKIFEVSKLFVFFAPPSSRSATGQDGNARSARKALYSPREIALLDTNYVPQRFAAAPLKLSDPPAQLRRAAREAIFGASRGCKPLLGCESHFPLR